MVMTRLLDRFDRSVAEAGPPGVSQVRSEAPRMQMLAELLQIPGSAEGGGAVTGAATSIQEMLSSLPLSQRQQLSSIWGEQLDHLIFLSHETDPTLFSEGLYQVGSRLLGQGDLGLAGHVFRFLQSRSEITPTVRRRSEQRLLVLDGQGPWRERLELSATQFFDALLDPGLLLGMGVGGLAYRAARLGILGRFAVAGRNPLGVRALSHLSGLMAESIAFTGVAKGIHSLTHEEDMSLAAWGRELAGTAILLGSLRLFGGITGQALQRIRTQAVGLQSLPGENLALFAGMYSGTVMGHGLQQSLDLVPRSSTENLLLDSLVTVFQFQLAGSLSRRLWGRRLQYQESYLDQRIRRMESNYPLHPPEGGSSWQWATAGVGPAIQGSPGSGSVVPSTILMMESRPPSGGGRISGENGSPQEVPSSPYYKGADGRLHITQPEQTVAVLGDVGGKRTLDLAAEGHRVIHIDRDTFTLNLAKRELEMSQAANASERTIPVDWQNADWYHSPLRADLVEAFFPINASDIPPPFHPMRLPTLKMFLDQAIHAKLGQNGRGVFIISEVSELIRDIKDLVRVTSGLRLLDAGSFESSRNETSPILGGYASLPKFMPGADWVLYQPTQPIGPDGIWGVRDAFRIGDWGSHIQMKLRGYQPILVPSRGMHGQVRNSSISQTRVLAEPPGEASAPQISYQWTASGLLSLPHQSQRVIVMGDVHGWRTAELALQGHRVLHLDHSEARLRRTQAWVSNEVEFDPRSRELRTDPMVTFFSDPENKMRAHSDFVEAFFPAEGTLREPIGTYLEQTLLNKLGDRGRGGLVVSQSREWIRELGERIDQNPEFNVLKIGLEEPPPIPSRGGIHPPDTSWVAFQKRPKP